MKHILVKIPAGATIEKHVSGRVLMLTESTDALWVTLNDGGTSVKLQPGQGMPSNNGFTSAVFENRTSTEVAAMVFVGPHAFIDNRITGEVLVINGAAVRTKNGEGFFSVTNSLAAVGLYSHCQLFNPAASGKRAILTSIEVIALSGATSVQLSYNNAALATPSGTARNKLVGSPLSSVLSYTEQSAGLLGNYFAAAHVETLKPKEVVLPEPIILEPGVGLIAAANDVNNFTGMTCQFYEEDI